MTPCDGDLESAVEQARSAKEKGAEVNADLQKEYQSLLGSLLYAATNSRPDIGYSVSMLGRALSCPNDDLLERARRVLRYLRAHRTIGLRYSASSSTLYGMSDANWAVRHSCHVRV